MREWIRGLSDRGEFILICLLCFSITTGMSLVSLLSGQSWQEISTARLLRAILMELGILVAMFAILRIRGWALERLGLRFSVPAALAGGPLFVVYMLLYWATALAVINLVPGGRDVLGGVNVTSTGAAGVMLVFIVLNSFFEEITVTGYVMGALAKDGPALAITASTLIRFGYHLYQGPVASISVLPLGLLFGVVYWRWRTVWPLIVAHTIANLISFWL